MSAGKLYAVPHQIQAHRIRAVAAFGGIDISMVGDEYVHGTTNKTPEFLAKFPTGKIPAFETPAGFHVCETLAIARYVAGLAKNSTLLGSSLEDQALIDQWISVADTGIFAPLGMIRTILNHRVPYNKPTELFLRERGNESLKVIEAHLATRTYLVTERITLADISVASVLKGAFETLVDAPHRAQLPNTVRFYNTIANHPLIKPVFGETAFVEKTAQYVPPAKVKPAKEAAPAAPKEKPAKAAAAKEAKDDDDDDEPLVPEEPKPKNPLDLLPKSTFNLEDWKRAYSNKDTRGPGGSLEWLYSNFDKEGFSIWKVEYKYNDELTLVFMSSNLIGGFFNRLEASRKYLFGSVGVLGQDHNSVVAGVFILRGKDYKPVVEVAPDWESYNFTAVNLEDKADKDYFEAALAWDLEIDGKKWADGKAFK